MKKILFSDVDRTLAINGIISDKTKDSIKRYVNLNNLFVLVSGRVIPYTTDLSKKINASSYVICTNGGIVYDYSNNKIIYKKTISFNVIETLFNLCNFYKARLIFGGLKTIYTNKLKYKDKETEIDRITKEIYDNNPVTQITISSTNKDILNKIIDEVKKINEVEIVNKHRSLYDESYVDNGSLWIDIAPIGVNKGIAVLKLLEHLNIKLEDSARIGDDLNDLPMFLDKGVNIAVENAIPKLKEKADFITKSCYEDGISYTLEKIMNEEL